MFQLTGVVNDMIFITGGARSGKSGLAERFASEQAALLPAPAGGNVAVQSAGGVVTYIATAEPKDGEMRERIAEHRGRRPESWLTVEASENLPDTVAAVLDAGGVVLVDCLTVYISNLLMNQGIASGMRAMRAVDREMDQLVEICSGNDGGSRLILVSNEVGMGIVPDNALARTFRDVAGRANQKLAAAADEVYLCVSGIPMKVK